jgi:hypothetical protein
VVPFPNCPFTFRPQHLAAPPAAIAHVWASPAARDVAPVRPVTATAVDEPFVVPFPNSPKPPLPQHLTAPPATITHVWA